MPASDCDAAHGPLTECGAVPNGHGLSGGSGAGRRVHHTRSGFAAGVVEPMARAPMLRRVPAAAAAARQQRPCGGHEGEHKGDLQVDDDRGGERAETHERGRPVRGYAQAQEGYLPRSIVGTRAAFNPSSRSRSRMARSSS
jgi:hypothetical protein